MASPLSQFEIKKIVQLDLFGYDISFTNSSLSMLITVILIMFFMLMGVMKLSLIPSRKQSLLKSPMNLLQI